MTRRQAGLLLGCTLGLLPAGCGLPAEPAEPVAATTRAIRPTDGDGWNGNGYGIPAEVYDPPGGHFRVFYVTSGDNAVALTDVAPMDGVPDFPQMVGAAAEATYQSTIVKRGFRPPLDDSIYHDRPDYGGDGRYDIYLRWVGPGSDGYRVSEVCTDGSDGGSAGRCSGYFVMNPSFKGTSYPSEQQAVEVLVSHELFHSVQDAYNAGQWRTWSEATAVWNELQVFPQSAGTFGDYRGFLPALFNQPERPFDKSMGSGPAASYAYGTAAWPEFLSERFDAALIRLIWEGCEQGPTGDAPGFLDATDAVLAGRYGSSLSAAWTEFTRWNLITGARAGDAQARSYARAAEYPLARLEPDLPALGQSASVELNGLSARYLRLPPSLTAATNLRVAFTDASGAPPVVAAYLSADAAKEGPLHPLGELAGGQLEHVLNPGEALLFAVTGAVRGAPTRLVQVTADVAPSTLPPSMSGGCSLAPHRNALPTSSPTLPFALLCALPLLRLRRRPVRR